MEHCKFSDCTGERQEMSFIKLCFGLHSYVLLLHFVFFRQCKCIFAQFHDEFQNENILKGSIMLTCQIKLNFQNNFLFSSHFAATPGMMRWQICHSPPVVWAHWLLTTRRSTSSPSPPAGWRQCSTHRASMTGHILNVKYAILAIRKRTEYAH